MLKNQEDSVLTAHYSQCGHLDEPKVIWMGKPTDLALETEAKQRWSVFHPLNLS